MAANNQGFPVTSYYFKVLIGGKEYGFKEVSGIKASVDFHPVEELGSRHEAPKILKGMKYESVTLKKGLVKGQSMIKEVLEQFKLEFDIHSDGKPLVYNDVFITLMSSDEKDLFSWILLESYPVSWEISGFDAMKNEVSIESLELNYKRLETVQH